MILPFIGAFAIAPSRVVWYGPAQVSALIPFTGNPFAADENDVRATFTKGKLRLERIAYFAHGKWHAKLKATEPGTFQVRFSLNSNPTTITP